MKHTISLTLCATLLGIGAALVAPVPHASAASYESARGGVDARLQQSLEELGQVRDRIAAEKVPLSRSVSELEEQVLELRQKRDRLLEVRDSRTIDLESLRKQVEALESQQEFIDSRLSEYVRDFEGRLDISELGLYEELTKAAKLAENNVNLGAEGKREAQLAVVRAAIDRIGEQLGGRVFEGEALGPDGVLSRGKFVALGPSVFFVSDDGALAGVVENQLNAADPVVVELPGGLDDAIASLAATGVGALPLDPTLGKALRVERARETLAQHLEKGGVIGYVILLLGATALLLTAFKALEILRFPVAEPALVDGVLDEIERGSRETAEREARQVEGIAGEMLVTGVEHADEKREILEELLFEKILRVRPTLERFLPFLAITAAAAPLLGLLGTVTGMIKTFQLLTIFGTGDAKSLSSGISEALVTTELGLMVAVPTLILHGALSRMAKHKLGLLEQLSMAFVNGLTAIRKPLTPVSPVRDA